MSEITNEEGGPERNPAPDAKDAVDSKETPAAEGDTNDNLPGAPDKGDPKEGDLPGAPDAEAKEGDETPKEGEGAPEKYELTVKEGYDLPAEAEKKFTDWARENKVSNELAQAMLDFDTERSVEAAEAKTAAEAAADKATEVKWQEDIRKEYGDDYNEAYARGNKAYALVPEEMKKTLDATNYNRSPEWFKFMETIGKVISEDKLVQGGDSKKGGETEQFNSYTDVLSQPNLGKTGVKTAEERGR